MSRSQLELKLIPVSKKLSKKGGYRGHIVGRREMGYDEVIEEAIKTSHLNFDAIAMKLVLESVFHSMINGIMKDGVSRRLGDYFTLQLEVKGGFDEPGDQFDPQKHKLAMVVRPLKEFRRVAGDKDVAVYNRNAGPKVVIAKTYSASHPEGGELKFGEDIIIEGENLFALEDGNDIFNYKYYSQFHKAVHCGGGSLMSEWVSADGKRIVIPWKETVGHFIELSMDKFDPAKNPPVAVMFGLRTHGGEATAKVQLHRARAYFDTWLAKYPEYRGDFSRTTWGDI